jgi:hypothetical protein
MSFLLPIIALLASLASGVWLSWSGRPMNIALFTLHKLLALSAVVLGGLRLYRSGSVTTEGMVWVSQLAVAVVCILALFISGALMSQDRPFPAALLLVHKVGAVVAIVLAAAVVYWINRSVL